MMIGLMRMSHEFMSTVGRLLFIRYTKYDTKFGTGLTVSSLERFGHPPTHLINIAWFFTCKFFSCAYCLCNWCYLTGHSDIVGHPLLTSFLVTAAEGEGEREQKVRGDAEGGGMSNRKPSLLRFSLNSRCLSGWFPNNTVRVFLFFDLTLDSLIFW